ncbi:MAG: hypothetical protein LBI62_03050 [Candidatus Accumulibacter sp.]|jgi:formylmethanofuran dehydrogenase subunit E|nr:hypothetical protein [Accumulibacter sp.]
MTDEEEIRECADCGAILDSPEQTGENADGEPICEDCAENYVACADCGEIVSRDSEYHDENGAPICESCAERYSTCGDCGATVHDDDATWIAGAEMLVCSTCLDGHYHRCEDCGRYASDDNSYGLGSGGRICNSCYERGDYGRCCDCGDLYPASDLNYDGDEDYCDDCFRMRQNDAGRAIHPYAYKPPWIHHRSRLDGGPREDDVFFLGIELEVENTSGGLYSNEDVAKTVKDLAPVVCKWDGSIHNGFEIVFHPQTYAYAMDEGRGRIEDCLRTLRQRRFSGHNHGGMHVHVGLSAFSRLHLYKFHQLFRNARALFAAISQRKPEKLEQWASFGSMPDIPNCNVNRYSALNYTSRTVEVRIFNSTLRTDRFHKNLETVKAAIDYSKQCGLRELDAHNFLGFVMRNRGQYRNLATFLVEKCVHSLDAVAVDVRVVRQVQKRIVRSAG